MSKPKLPRPTPRMVEMLELIETHGPVSANTLTDLGIWCRQDIDYFIRELKAEKLIHVADYDPSPCRDGYTVKRWVIGDGEDAKRPHPPKKKYPRHRKDCPRSVVGVKAQADKEARLMQERNRPARRDPLIEALFGAAA